MISRDEIRSGAVMRMVDACAGHIPIFTEDDMAQSIEATLTEAPADVRTGADAWIFGYGSLMWNPALETEERRIATIFGYHRRFCLRTPLGRGTPDQPGLVLGLDRGGSCKGVAYRIAHSKIREEFAVLWRREMVSDGYIPRWVSLGSDRGPLNALTFVINRDCPRYAGPLSDQETAQTIAKATGDLGSNTEYLLSTVAHLEALGIPDRRLHTLRACLLDQHS